MGLNIIDKAKIALDGLMTGLKGGDEVITQKASYNSDESSIIQEQTKTGIWSDFLAGKETEQVVEMRDKYYRVLKAADQYKVKINMPSNGDERGDNIEEGVITASATKKKKNDLLKIDVYNPENYEIRIIQDNRMILKHTMFDLEGLSSSEKEQYEPLLNIERDGFTPRFELEQYAKKIVVRNINENRAKIDIYISAYAEQFNKTSSLFISEMNRIFDKKMMRSDITDISKIYFYSERGWGCSDGCSFEYDDIHFNSINVYDGNFVLTFDCNIVKNGIYVGEKYITESLTKKYENNSPKGKTIPFEVAERMFGNNSEDRLIIE